MTDADAEAEADAGSGGEADWERRRRLARVFGDALPDTTADERDPEAGARDAATGGAAGESASEAWLKAQVPPHHG